MGLNRISMLISVAASLVVPSTASAYRTFADDPVVASPARLRTDTLMWALVVPGQDAEARSEIQQAALDAFSTWARPPCTTFLGEIQFVTAEGHAVPGDGISTIEVVRGNWGARGLEAGRGATTDVQLLRDDAGNVSIREADVYLDFEDYRWSVDGTDGTIDVQSVLTHEIGHALGLLHPCDDSSNCAAVDEMSTMYPTYIGASGRRLSEDDIAGVCVLYPAVECGPGCSEGQICSGGVCRRVCDPSDVMCRTCSIEPCQEPRCETSLECGLNHCASVGRAEGTCVLAGTLGAECSAAADCGSQLCVVSTAASYCTAACHSDPDCADEGLICRAIDGARVCALPLATSNCSVRESRGRSREWMAVVGLLVGANLGRARLKRSRR